MNAPRQIRGTFAKTFVPFYACKRMCLEPAGRSIEPHSNRVQTHEHKQCSCAMQSVKLNRQKLASNLCTRTHQKFSIPLNKIVYSE